MSEAPITRDELAQMVTDRDTPPHQKVDPSQACPSCHEDDPDKLIWQGDDEIVKCSSCGTTYTP